jgi:hypothetical protein
MLSEKHSLTYGAKSSFVFNPKPFQSVLNEFTSEYSLCKQNQIKLKRNQAFLKGH